MSFADEVLEVPDARTLEVSDAAARADQLRANQAQIGVATKAFRQSLPFGTGAHFARPEWRGRVHDARLVELVEGYDPARDGCALITGPSGVGKTTAAAVLPHRLLTLAFRCGDKEAPIVGAVWTSAPALQRARYETKRGSVDESFAPAVTAKLLFLDELGGEDGDGRWLMSLADERYRASLPTVTTAGFPLHVLRERYGVGAIRKLVEPIGTHLDLFGARGG